MSGASIGGGSTGGGSSSESILVALLSRAIDFLRALPFVVPTALGHKVQAILATDSAINSVAAVTTVTTVTNVTNMNTIDSREMIWAMWMNTYNEGVRSKIV